MRLIVTQANFTGDPLADLKRWLSITGTAQDDLLVGLLEASHVAAEAFTGVFPLRVTVSERIAASCDWTTLSSRPYAAFRMTSAVTGLGVARTLASTAYQFEDTGDAIRFRLTEAVEEPRIDISFDAGLTQSWASLDRGLRHGMLRFAAHQYRERDAGASTALPAAVAALWRPWRRVRL